MGDPHTPEGAIAPIHTSQVMYENTFLPYYDMMSLNDYPNVNPATEPGQTDRS